MDKLQEVVVQTLFKSLSIGKRVAHLYVDVGGLEARELHGVSDVDDDQDVLAL